MVGGMPEPLAADGIDPSPGDAAEPIMTRTLLPILANAG